MNRTHAFWSDNMTHFQFQSSTVWYVELPTAKNTNPEAGLRTFSFVDKQFFSPNDS